MRRPDEYTLGVDIGQSRDYTAIAALRRVPIWTGETKDEYVSGARYPTKFFKYRDDFHLGLLERMPLHTPYAAIGMRVGDILHRCGGSASAVLDQTGVGRPVVEMMHHLPIVPVTITSGQGVSSDEDGWKVGKRFLVAIPKFSFRRRSRRRRRKGRKSLLAVSVGSWSKGLKLIDDFLAEMMAFKVKTSSAGHQSFESWREGVHDDLVLAVCLAAWWASRSSTGWLPLPPDEHRCPTPPAIPVTDPYYEEARKFWRTKADG